MRRVEIRAANKFRIILCSTKITFMKSCRGSRCGNCQGFLAAIRATRRYINKRYRENRKQHFLSRFPFHLLCSYLCTAFSSFRSLVYCAHFCIYVHVCITCIYLLSGTSPGARISPFLSRFHNSPAPLIFSKGKRARELDTPCLQASSLYESSSLISICRLFVFISPFSLIIAIVR